MLASQYATRSCCRAVRLLSAAMVSSVTPTTSYGRQAGRQAQRQGKLATEHAHMQALLPPAAGFQDAKARHAPHQRACVHPLHRARLEVTHTRGSIVAHARACAHACMRAVAAAVADLERQHGQAGERGQRARERLRLGGAEALEAEHGQARQAGERRQEGAGDVLGTLQHRALLRVGLRGGGGGAGGRAGGERM